MNSRWILKTLINRIFFPDGKEFHWMYETFVPSKNNHLVYEKSERRKHSCIITLNSVYPYHYTQIKWLTLFHFKVQFFSQPFTYEKSYCNQVVLHSTYHSNEKKDSLNRVSKKQKWVAGNSTEAETGVVSHATKMKKQLWQSSIIEDNKSTVIINTYDYRPSRIGKVRSVNMKLLLNFRTDSTNLFMYLQLNLFNISCWGKIVFNFNKFKKREKRKFQDK